MLAQRTGQTAGNDGATTPPVDGHLNRGARANAHRTRLANQPPSEPVPSLARPDEGTAREGEGEQRQSAP